MTSQCRLHTESRSSKCGGAHLNSCGNGLTCFLNSWSSSSLSSLTLGHICGLTLGSFCVKTETVQVVH